MKSSISNWKISVSIFLMIVAVLAAGCSLVQPKGTSLGTYNQGQTFVPSQNIESLTFKTADEFSAFVKQNEGGAYYYGGYRTFDLESGTVIMEEVSADSSTKSAPTASGAGESGQTNDFSQTNNQIANVDEADIIKTDGDYVYTISGRTLYIIKAYPGEDAEIVSTIKFNQTPEGLFINGDYLAVFGYYYDIDFFKEINFQPRQGMTFFNIYDISEKETPEIVKEYKFEGRYFRARMIDDYVYFVVVSGMEYRTDYPTPMIIDGTVKAPVPVGRIYYYNIPYQNPEFATIHAIKLSEANLEDSKTITVEGSENMYMSEKNIYITYTKYINEYELQRQITIEIMQDKLTDADKALIEKVKLTDDEILSQQEKEDKILQIVYTYINFMSSDEQQKLNDKIDAMVQEKLKEYKYFEFTIINKVGVKDGEITIGANGEVPGAIINQFSLDENGDVLRIATTINQRWSRFDKQTTESTNNVYTLDKDLKVLDKLDSIAKGERIYSTRFIRDKLYMVTFRQVDPFFVIDLSNPDYIKELGQLKIPGFSRYLHPYDDTTIIGIGQDASETGRQRGLKISLFDVSDFENPKEIAKFVAAGQYSSSTAEYEHKAFLFSKEKELLVIPAYSYSYDSENRGQSYNGAMVFNTTKDSIELRGIIDHSMGSDERYGSMVERSLYINELLYTKSRSLLRINKIADLNKVKNIELENQDSPYPVY